ncbi:MAG: M14 family metallopeptidase [Pyrinomonadaceae bacterium]
MIKRISRFPSPITHHPSLITVFLVLLTAFCLPLTASGQTVPTPKDVLGFHPTDDRTIADWGQITGYFNKLDAASDKVKVEEIGKTTLGKPQIVAFISSAENIKKLKFYQALNHAVTDPNYRLSGTENIDPIKEGKTIVAISCSIHSTEIVASQMSMLLAYDLATSADDKTKEILDNTILLLIPSANPDGIDIVADWYRKTLGTKYEGSSPPEIYHHYAGHDDNRDWFMMNLAETRNITRLFWQEWFPQIVYDIHQQGQNGSRFTLPPFFDPPNPRIDPLILRELGLIGYKMASDQQRIGQTGVATNSVYDTWWHGGFRSAPYYHNAIGILSEAASADLMSPITVSKKQLEEARSVRGLSSPLEAATNMPSVWEGGEWHPRDIARIEMTASLSLLEMAAKFRRHYLENSHGLATENLSPDESEPQAFIIPAGQPRQETVARFLEILMWQGMQVHEMTRELEVAQNPDERDRFGEIPLGSFLVFVNQTQKDNVLSLFEKQVYPKRLNANGEAEVPYDVAGWTLPLQMGVETATAWRIKELDKYRNTLKPVNDINQARAVLNLKPSKMPFDKLPNPLRTNPKIGLYKGNTGSMDEGWTRLVLDNHQIKYDSLSDADLRGNRLDYDAVILPSISERGIVQGLPESRFPKEYAGGIGDEGVENLKKFVEGGGKLICFDDSCELVIKTFDLPVKNALGGLKRSEFYGPGSIWKLEVDTSNPLAKGFSKETPAYFINSSAYEIGDPQKVKTIARYSEKDALLSGWILGEKYAAGKTALAESDFGRGKLILFAFRPQHRGQTFGTFPFIFNALEK